MLPSEWRLRRIGEFLTESRIPGTDGRQASKLSVKLYGRGVVPKQDSRGGSENTKYYVRRAGQLIYSKLDFLNGAFGIIPEELDGYESTLDLPTFDISDGVDANWLLSFVGREQFYSSQQGSAKGGRKARRVAPDEFLDLEIPVPPLPEQRKIAAILGSVDDAIRATQSVIEQTRTVKQGLLQELLTRGIGHTRFKQTEIGEVPEGWEVLPLAAVARVQTGVAKGKKNIVDPVSLPYLRVANVQDGYLDLSEIKEITVSRADVDRYRVLPGDVLLTECHFSPA
jgi:type I restriction enzyme, S subunit